MKVEEYQIGNTVIEIYDDYLLKSDEEIKLTLAGIEKLVKRAMSENQLTITREEV